MSRIHHHRRKGRIIAPCHSHRWSDAGVQRLLDNPNIEINSQVGNTVLILNASDIIADASWPAIIGPDLTFDNLGAACDYDQKTQYFGAKDRAVKFNEGDGFVTASNAVSLDADCFWIEAIIKRNAPSGTHYLFGTVDDTAHGWTFREAAADAGLMGFNAYGTGGSSGVGDIPCPDGAYSFISVAGDPARNINGYGNGGVSTFVGSGSYTTLATSSGFRVGARNTSTPDIHTNASVAYLSVTKFPSWFPGAPDAELLALHKEHFALLTGSKVHKSWNGVTLPTTNTCDAATYLYKVESGVTKLHKVGKNHLKICSKAISGVGNVKFALVEGAATQVCTETNTFAVWGGSTHTSTTESDPAGGSTATRMPFSTPLEVYNRDLTAATVANKQVGVSVWAKRISGGTQLYLASVDGASWAQSIQGAVTVTDEWTRLKYTGTFGAGAAANVTMVIATKDNKGGGAAHLPEIEVDLFEAQMEVGDYPSSEIDNATRAEVTRPVATLKEDITGLLGGTFSIRGSFVAPTFTPDEKKVICHLAADASNYIQISISTSGLLEAVTAIGTGDAGAVSCAGSVCEDDKLIRFQLSGKAGKLMLQYRMNDDTVSTIDIDSAVDIPLALTELSIGHDAAPAYHFAPCGLCDLQISRLFSASLSEPFSGHSVLDLT